MKILKVRKFLVAYCLLIAMPFLAFAQQQQRPTPQRHQQQQQVMPPPQQQVPVIRDGLTVERFGPATVLEVFRHLGDVVWVRVKLNSVSVPEHSFSLYWNRTQAHSPSVQIGMSERTLRSMRDLMAQDERSFSEVVISVPGRPVLSLTGFEFEGDSFLSRQGSRVISSDFISLIHRTTENISVTTRIRDEEGRLRIIDSQLHIDVALSGFRRALDRANELVR